MNDLANIVQNAIEYTERILQLAPHYRGAALKGLVKLRDKLASGREDDPAIQRLNAYLDSLIEPPSS